MESHRQPACSAQLFCVGDAGRAMKALDFLNSNELLREFVKEDFDVKEFTSKSIQELGIAQQLSQLAEALAVLDRELKQHVCGSYEDLLIQATAIDTLEEDLKNIQLRIQALLSAIERLRLKVVEPYQKINNLTVTLSRLQSACDLLRCIVRISALTKKLEAQLERGSSEISKCAQTLSELGFLMSGVDLSGLEVLSNDQKLIRRAKKEVEQQAVEMLDAGIKNQDQTQVGIALQVFHNLGRLVQAVQKVTEGTRLRLERGVKEALDLKELSGTAVPSEFKSGMPGRATMPTPGNAAAFRATLWSNMEKLTEEIFVSCSQVQLLQKVLFKKRDPISHQLLGEELSRMEGTDGDAIAAAFWNSVASILTKELVQAANDSTFIKQAFEGEYPKLLRLNSDLWKRLDQFSDVPSRFPQPSADPSDDVDEIPSSHSSNFEPEKHLRKILSPFENSYLSRSLSRLFDPVNLMFSNGEAPPAPSEVDNAVKAIASELTVACVDGQLARTVTKNVVNTVHLFTTKCEQMLANGPDATQVIGPPTEDQSNNAAIIDLLHLYEKQMQKLLEEVNPNFPKDAVETISSSLKSIGSTATTGFEPLLMGIEKAIEDILLTMHQEDWSGNLVENVSAEVNGVNQPCSPYMKELQHFVSRVNTDYFSLCRASDQLLQASGKRIASRTLELFLRFASLVRPLGDAGKRKLAADCAQLEMCLSILCPQLNDIGKTYKTLRAFRPLLFQTNEHVCQSSVVGDTVPYSLTLHLLFSRAPADFRSPHQTAGWSVSEYSKWLDRHKSEIERLELIRGALESYVNIIRHRKGKEFAPVYPIMLNLLQEAFQHLST